MNKPRCVTKACGIFLLWATGAIILPGQTLTTLHSFNGTDGSYPRAALVQATNGNLYGTTAASGTSARGTIFKITSSGTLTTLYTFCPNNSHCSDGASPLGALAQGSDGDLYGTTDAGGSGHGTIFKSTPDGVLKTLYSFCPHGDCTDGSDPSAGLVLGTDGNWYGTTSAGGVSGIGTVFKITPSGELTTLYRFCMQSHCPDGRNPSSGLVQGNDGNFYGTTQYGGANDDGTVFKITPSGELATLHSFEGTDGDVPNALVQGTDGDFYGTTESGGANVFYGTVFKIAPTGQLTTLHSFCSQSGCADGDTLFAGLIQGSDGNFYGTTFIGGANSNGTVFKITPTGELTTLYSFCSQNSCTDGYQPLGAVFQDTNGKLYGTTGYGGSSNACYDGCGTVFSLSVGLVPFVEAQPTSGNVGVAVNILGTNLIGATSVTFNGTAATFTVKSKSEVTTTVPAGATTGTVQVVTPGGTLSSNVPFMVN